MKPLVEGKGEHGGATGGVLFVIPTADRNGATAELLHFLRWFKAHSVRPFSALFGAGGDFLSEYSRVVETWPADRSHWCPGGVRSRAFNSIGFGGFARAAEKRDVRRFAGGCSPAVIYVNSLTTENSRLVALLGMRVPVLMWVHELEWFMQRQAGPNLPAVLSQATRFIACSNAVRENLIRHHEIAPDRIDTVHEGIPVVGVEAQRSREEILQELGLPNDAVLVIASGLLYWGKGADLFVQLAAGVCRRRPNTYFAWIGQASPEQILQFTHDIHLAGLGGRVRHTGAVSRPTDYFAAADAFVLTSREDSFPLVCLEAAALGKPIVCFADAGGMPEFVESDCGFVVPYLDIGAMAERVIFLLDSRECRLRMGEAARRKVAQHYDINVTAPRIMNIIERMAAEAGPRTCERQK